MKCLAIVSPPSIYHGCSTPKTFWSEKLAGEKKELFEPVSIKTVESAMLGNIRSSKRVMRVSPTRTSMRFWKSQIKLIFWT